MKRSLQQQDGAYDEGMTQNHIFHPRKPKHFNKQATKIKILLTNVLSTLTLIL